MGEDDNWDFGTGAGNAILHISFWTIKTCIFSFFSFVLGFYVNATTEGWKENYHMFDYVNTELFNLVKSNFKTTKWSGNDKFRDIWKKYFLLFETSNVFFKLLDILWYCFFFFLFYFFFL